MTAAECVLQVDFNSRFQSVRQLKSQYMERIAESNSRLVEIVESLNACGTDLRIEELLFTCVYEDGRENSDAVLTVLDSELTHTRTKAATPDCTKQVVSLQGSDATAHKILIGAQSESWSEKQERERYCRGLQHMMDGALDRAPSLSGFQDEASPQQPEWMQLDPATLSPEQQKEVAIITIAPKGLMLAPCSDGSVQRTNGEHGRGTREA